MFKVILNYLWWNLHKYDLFNVNIYIQIICDVSLNSLIKLKINYIKTKLISYLQNNSFLTFIDQKERGGEGGERERESMCVFSQNPYQMVSWNNFRLYIDF